MLVILFSIYLVLQDQSLSGRVARLDPELSTRLRATVGRLADAQLRRDRIEVEKIAREAIALLGDQAGLPETADRPLEIPRDSQPLETLELRRSFRPYLDRLEREKWWRKGLDPTKTNHAAREAAAVIEGCLGAAEVDDEIRDRCLALARDAADYLIWTQDRAGSGVFPFPAVRRGRGRPFEVAERFLERAESEGRIHEMVRNGWIFEDLGDGGLKFDNGRAGVALFHLHARSRDPELLRAARRSADWAVERPCVPNWNYNAFSTELLAEAFSATQDPRYLAAAKRELRLGLLPGRLEVGPRRGRWADPHNARPAYHYIMVRALVVLLRVLPANDPDRGAVIEAIRDALNARNLDVARSLVAVDPAIEAFVAIESLDAADRSRFAGTSIDEALESLERYASSGIRSGRPRVGPGAWGAWIGRRGSPLRSPSE
ncbi:MAG: hypothetical protein SFX72_03605 [Isosphaeraceae bacterium]|nr:hypothetical protein [Isosphaeraceae bacterium]